jgi:Subtilase family
MLVEQQRSRSRSVWLREGGVYRISANVFALACAFLFFSKSAVASYQDTIGYPELQAQLGASIPTGAGIEVQHVEALNQGLRYFPGAHAEFSGKNITNVTYDAGATQGTTLGSGHAQDIGITFYGDTVSIAPGITDIQSYEAFHWLGYNYNSSTKVLTPTPSGFLNTGSGLGVLPDITTARIANHSWSTQFSTGSTNSEVLRRLDYVVERDDFLNIVGILNGDGGTDLALLKTAFNEISVGRTDAVHREGTLGVDSTYTAGRIAPELVAPGFGSYDDEDGDPPALLTSTSSATGMVSSATALLLEVAQDPLLSEGTITNRTRTINHAETSEVIKAILMAGADRAVDNPRGPDLANYTIDTPNNLDLDYGAGQINVFHSYNILAAGEHDSDQDRGVSLDIGDLGWDYDPHFGGASSTNDRGSYFFTATNTGDVIHATLAWNIQVTGFSSSASNTTLRDLNLVLYDVTNNQMLSAAGASSLSTTENTENIFFSGLVAGNRYEIRVETASGQPAFDWDYGLAWQIGKLDVGQVPEPSSVVISILGALSMLAAGRWRHRTSRGA